MVSAAHRVAHRVENGVIRHVPTATVTTVTLYPSHSPSAHPQAIALQLTLRILTSTPRQTFYELTCCSLVLFRLHTLILTRSGKHAVLGHDRV